MYIDKTKDQEITLKDINKNINSYVKFKEHAIENICDNLKMFIESEICITLCIWWYPYPLNHVV